VTLIIDENLAARWRDFLAPFGITATHSNEIGNMALRQIRSRFRQRFALHRASPKRLCGGTALGDSDKISHATPQRRNEEWVWELDLIRRVVAPSREKSE